MSMLISGVAKRIGRSDKLMAADFRKKASARLKEIHVENPGIPISFRMHTDMNIFPAIAAYETMCSQGIAPEKAMEYIGSFFNNLCDKYAAVLRFGIKVFHLVHKTPQLMVDISLKTYKQGKDGSIGFTYRMPEKRDKRIARFDITSCPYAVFCRKYDCMEIMPLFCNSDDHKYGNMHRDLLWDRTGTIGKGNECCDFRLVDISRYPDYERAKAQ